MSAMVTNTNISAIRASRLLHATTDQLSRSLSRLSSGAKIRSPADDSAGLGQFMKLSSEARRHGAAATNLGNAISYTMTQDGYLQKIQKALDRMGQLSVLAQDATKTDDDRVSYNQEFQQLLSATNDFFLRKFNGVNLFAELQTATTNVSASGNQSQNSSGAIGTTYPDGTFDITFTYTSGNAADRLKVYSPSGGGSVFSTSIPQPGVAPSTTVLSGAFSGSAEVEIVVNEGGLGPGEVTTWSYTGVITAFQYEPFEVTTDGGTTNSLSVLPQVAISSGVNLDTIGDAAAAQSTVQSFTETVARYRGLVGSNLTRLQMNSEMLGDLQQNLSAAASQIMDVDVALESTEYARTNLLVQSGAAMLAQANVQPEMALRLIGG
jgi:flagellin